MTTTAANAALPGLKQRAKDADEETKKPIVPWEDLIVALRRKKDKDGNNLKRDEASKIDDNQGRDKEKHKQKEREAEKDKAVNSKADKIAPSGEKELEHYTK